MSLVAAEFPGEGVSHRLLAQGARRASLFIWIGDVASILVAILLAHAASNFVRSLLGFEILEVSSEKFVDEFLLSLALGSFLVVWLFARKHYSTRQTISSQMKDLFVGCMGALTATALLSFLIKSDPSRLSVVLTWGFAGLLILVTRQLIRAALIKNGSWFAPTLLLAAPQPQRRIELIVRAHRELGIQVVSNMTISQLLQQIEAVGSKGTPGLLRDLLQRVGAVKLIIAPSRTDLEDALELIEYLQRFRVPYVYAPETGTLSVDNMMVQSLAPFDGVLMAPLDNLDRPFARVAKSIFDRALSFAGLVLFLPVIAIISIAIKSDGGPIFFAQERIGRNGKLFRCLKFRTMAVDAEAKLKNLLEVDDAAAAQWDLDQKLKNDPRITPVGKLLRATSIDELPQLINVLKGEMSIVGPRPVVPDEIDKYGDYANYYFRVHPGLTGLWQVNGRNNTTYEERVRLDAYYVRNWTLWRDFCIAIKTIPEMFWNRSGV